MNLRAGTRLYCYIYGLRSLAPINGLTRLREYILVLIQYEYQNIFSDVPKVTNLIEHKVQLTETEPVKHKSYSIPYKMQKDIDKEIDDTLATGVIERSEAPYASPLVLVKKPDNTKKAITSPDRTGSKVYYQSGNV